MLFIALEGIAGNSRDIWHPDEIELQSFSLGVIEATDAETAPAGGQGQWSLSLCQVVDSTTPRLIQACHSGRIIPRACLTQQTATERPTDILRITMSGVRVSSITLGSAGDNATTVAWSLHFEELSVDCRDRHPDGSPASSGSCGPLTCNATQLAEGPCTPGGKQ